MTDRINVSLKSGISSFKAMKTHPTCIQLSCLSKQLCVKPQRDGTVWGRIRDGEGNHPTREKGCVTERRSLKKVYEVYEFYGS